VKGHNETRHVVDTLARDTSWTSTTLVDVGTARQPRSSRMKSPSFGESFTSWRTQIWRTWTSKLSFPLFFSRSLFLFLSLSFYLCLSFPHLSLSLFLFSFPIFFMFLLPSFSLSFSSYLVSSPISLSNSHSLSFSFLSLFLFFLSLQRKSLFVNYSIDIAYSLKIGWLDIDAFVLAYTTKVYFIFWRRQEGVDKKIYRRFRVDAVAEDGTKYRCWTYQLTRPEEKDRRPSAIYKSVIIRGALVSSSFFFFSFFPFPFLAVRSRIVDSEFRDVFRLWSNRRSSSETRTEIYDILR
jgi:hypothetical protein